PVPHVDLLEKTFSHWKQIAQETVAALGDERASLFVYLYNDALDIGSAVRDSYSEEERGQSLTFVDFMGVCKEIHWLGVIFLAGTYPLVLGRLRFIWELIFRAVYADTYAPVSIGDRHGPGPTAQDKHQWLEAHEDELGWGSLILPLLQRLFVEQNPNELSD